MNKKEKGKNLVKKKILEKIIKISTGKLNIVNKKIKKYEKVQ